MKLDVDLVSVSHDLREGMATVERAGFDGAFFSEVTSDPLVAAGYAAATSERIELGTAIAVAFARNPMSLAVAGWDLQDLSGGRFLLGIGSQVRAHITQRYSMPWSDPAPRMREYIAAVREIWRCFRDEEPLDFRGDYYRHTLLTPVFRPHRTDLTAPPILLGAVGPAMTRVAIEHADGLLLHPLASGSYVSEVLSPAVAQHHRGGAGLVGGFTIRAMPYVATGSDEAQIDRAAARIRQLIAFHGSTPAYAPLLDHHGWRPLHEELHRLSREQAWEAMSRLVDDEVLHTFALVGDPATVAREAVRRYGGVCGRLSLYTPDILPGALWAEVAAAVRATPGVHTPEPAVSDGAGGVPFRSA